MPDGLTDIEILYVLVLMSLLVLAMPPTKGA